MPSLMFSNLNSAFTLSFQRAVSVRQRLPSFGLVETLSAKRGSFNLRTISSSNRVMAASSPNIAASGTNIAASGDIVVDNSDVFGCGSVSSFAKPSGVYFGYKGMRNNKKGVLGMNVGGRNSGYKAIPFGVFDSLRMSGNPYQVVGGLLNGGCGEWSVRCYADGATSEVSAGGSSPVDLDQLSTVGVPADEQETLSCAPLKLLSGVCYLPHPDKEKTGGEDAHFICTEEQVIGVADGVGGWADLGINAGYYARELMSNCVTAIQDEPKGLIDPARVLDKAHKWTKSKGSSTACIIALADKGLHAINLGDSGFIVVRDGRTVFESPVQQHSFNFTFQLESGSNSDLPSSGQVFTIPVEPGDVIVAGTDGLFDNLYNNEVSSTVAHAITAGLSPDSTAQKIAALARQRALDRKRQTPFSAAAQEAGYHYYGGKLDDITVVVAYISN